MTRQHFVLLFDIAALVCFVIALLIVVGTVTIGSSFFAWLAGGFVAFAAAAVVTTWP